jgi:transposase
MAQTISVLGLDLATRVCHVVGMDDSGPVVLRKRLARSELLTFIANVPPLRMGMEAWGSAHDWARCVREYGPEVRVIAPLMWNRDPRAWLLVPVGATPVP